MLESLYKYSVLHVFYLFCKCDTVHQALEKRVPIARMTNVAACLDPGVRALILNDDECRKLLLETYEEIKQSV